MLGVHDSAGAKFEESRQILIDALGDSHPLIAESRTNLAELHYYRGECQEASSELEKALAILDIKNPDHPLTAVVAGRLARSLEA